MADSMKIRTTMEGDYIEVKALIKHPMETGIRKDKAGNPIPAHYIEDLTAEANGKVVFSAEWGSGIATNPYISFKFKGAKAGDMLTLSWKDNKGESDSLTVPIK
ncbi:MAG: thiosulfate oxidation carrier complex protein SoxZ [Chromatiales bacterium]|nr:thiosulfate oxidation carrier complex protein SoxZ [Chromatiales bacterium]